MHEMPRLKSLSDPIAKELAINRVEVRLACHRAPVFAFRLDTHNSDLKSWDGHFRNPEEPCRVQFQADGTQEPLDVSLLGLARRSELDGFGPMLQPDDSGNPFYAVATISGYPEFKKWFETTPAEDDPPAWLIYQLGWEESPWELARRSLDSQVEQPGTDDSLSHFLGKQGCLVRSSSWTNGQFLDHLTGLMASRVTGIRDWTLFDSTPAVRFVETLRPYDLDDNHWHLERQWLPALLADAWWEGQPRRLMAHFEIREYQVAAFFARLTKFGFQNRARELAGEFDGLDERSAGQLVLVPGAVRYRGAPLLVSAIRYSWDRGAKVEAVLEVADMNARVGDRNANAAAIGSTPALLLDATFRAWHTRENGEEYLEAVPFSRQDDRANSWKVITHGDAESLLLRATMPGQTLQEDLKGCYVRHEAGDLMQVLLVEGATPLSLGGLQTYTEACEQASVSIPGKIVKFPFQEQLLIGDEVLTVTQDKVSILSKVHFQ